MNTIRKNSQGYGYRYSDLSEIHRFLEESGERYYQEVKVIGGHDYIVTICLDASGKELRRCRGCRIPQATLAGKANEAQQYGSGLTYARRYSLLLAYGLCTADDGKAFDRPRARDKSTQVNPEPNKTEPVKHTLDRTQAVNRISQLVNSGKLALEEVQATVRKYGVAKMNELSDDAFAECVATLTKSA